MRNTGQINRLPVPEEVKKWFENFLRLAAEWVRAIVRAVAERFPELREMIEREQVKRRRIRQLSYRKKKSQAKNWRKWRRKRRRRPDP